MIKLHLVLNSDCRSPVRKRGAGYKEQSGPAGSIPFAAFGDGQGCHYLSWRSHSDSSSTGLTKPAYSELPLSSRAAAALTKSFSHSSPLESSEAEAGWLPGFLLLNFSAARRMSSSVLERSRTGIILFMPAILEELK